jgi:hypothetical protein
VNRIAVPRFIVSKRITIPHNPIKNQTWPSDLGIGAITLDVGLDDGGLPDA